MRRLIVVLALASGFVNRPTVAFAQQRDTVAQVDALPADVAREVVALYNGSAALRSTDRVEIPAGRTVAGNIAVLNGPLMLSGRVTGRVLAINSDVVLAPGARIDGDLLVVGGDVEGLSTASVGGETRLYRPPLRYTLDGDLLAVADQPADGPSQWWRRFERLGRRNSNRLEIATAGVYNRVEGLPVRVGPVLYRDQGWGHLRVDAFAILRTSSTFAGTTADVGHDLRSELRIGREYGATMGGRLFDVVDGVESWQLSDAEVGLATFLFHRDYRDYYERHGGEMFASARATDNADFTLAYSDERWRSRDAHDPPTLVRNGSGWRENPSVDAGRFHLLNATLRVDTRNDPLNPWVGWYVLANYERGVGAIDSFGTTSPGVRDLPVSSSRYQRGFLDVRRYNRLAPDAALNLRVVLAGWLGGDPLPLERRLSIDGPGTVPGFDFRTRGQLDVGTCATSSAPPGRPAQCERIALAQLEYKSDFHMSLGQVLEGEARRRVRLDGAWVFFSDAGRGWLVNSPGTALTQREWLPALSTYRTDIGTGVVFEHLGLYVAKALSDPKEPVNFLVRVRHRF